MLDKEKIKHTTYSPGFVTNEEILIRAIIDPDHCKDGELISGAISRDDLISRGFSVFRKQYEKKAHFNNMVNAYLSKNFERKCEGVAKFPTLVAREINNEDGRQAFIVLDDAKIEDDHAHAQILFSEKYSRSKQLKLRKQLLQVLKTLYTIDEVFEDEKNNDFEEKKRPSSLSKITNSFSLLLNIFLKVFFRK